MVARLDVEEFGVVERALVFGAVGAAIIIGCGRVAAPQLQLYGLGPVGHRRVHGMMAGRQDDQEVHLGAEIEVVAGLGVIRNEGETSVVVGRQLAEEVNVGDEVAGVEAVLGQLNEEVVAGVAVPGVAGGLVVFGPPFLFNVCRGIVSAEGVVPAEGIASNGEHRAAHVRDEDVASR